MRAAVPAALLSLCLLLAPPTARAQPAPGLDTYSRAIAAIKRNDCVTAVRELEAYKKEAASELRSNSVFAAQIEDQIARCRALESLRQTTIVGSNPSTGSPVASTPGTSTGAAAGWGNHRQGDSGHFVGRSIELRN